MPQENKELEAINFVAEELNLPKEKRQYRKWRSRAKCNAEIDDKIRRNTSRNLEKLRMKYEMTVAAYSRMIGLFPNQYKLIIEERQNVSLTKLVEICYKLYVSPLWLIGMEKDIHWNPELFNAMIDDKWRNSMKNKMQPKFESGRDADDAHDPYGENSDIGAQGFRKIAFGPDDKVNYRINGADAPQPRPRDEEKTDIHNIVEHMVQSKFYSDDKNDLED